jgi:plasmid stabilization system protein ParE
MAFEVIWLASVEWDINDTADYVAACDSPARAEHPIEKLRAATGALASHPNAGTHVQAATTQT